MGFVYKIVNLTNNKVYIGITRYKNPNIRFNKHIAEHIKGGNYSKRPLYEAMKKYGVENFNFQVIEEVPNNLLGKREQYWIDYYKSYVGFEKSNGYNATLGGDGGHQVISPREEKQIINAYVNGCSMRYIVNHFHHSWHTIITCLKLNNVVVRFGRNRKIAQLDKELKVLKIFKNTIEANEYLGKDKYSSKIYEVCNGKRKFAYGYVWKFV